MLEAQSPQRDLFRKCAYCVSLGRSLYGAAMPNADDCNRPNRPGPKPQFGYRMELRLRDDQQQALARIAATLGVTVSDLVRWFVDNGIDAVENVPTFKTLERMSYADDC